MDAKEPNPSIGSGDSKNPPEPSQLQATSPDTPGNDTYAPPSDASSQNATSATPPAGNTTATPEVSILYPFTTSDLRDLTELILI